MAGLTFENFLLQVSKSVIFCCRGWNLKWSSCRGRIQTFNFEKKNPKISATGDYIFYFLDMGKIQKVLLKGAESDISYFLVTDEKKI